MSEQEGPPRLIDDPELGRALRAARDQKMSPEQIAANGRALDARLTKLPAPGRFPLGTSALTLGAVVAVVVLARVIAGPVLFGTDPLATVTPAVTLAAMSPSITPVVAMETAALATPVATRTLAGVPTPTKEITLGTLENIPTATPTPRSTLAEELRLFDEARALEKEGHHSKALLRLGEIERRYPNTMLGPEIDVTRAEIYVSSERFDEASEVLTALVNDPTHAGRRVELLRTLGDVERALGNCDAATKRYREALLAGAAGEEASAARRGLGACQAVE